LAAGKTARGVLMYYPEVNRLSDNLYPGCQRDTKTIYIKTFYETEDYESLVTQVDAFRHFLKRDKTIRDIYKDQITGFLNYTTKFAKLKLNINDEIYELHKIIREDLKVDPLQKLWLMEKAQEISALPVK
jgi:RNA binding exosome subunit